MIAKITNGTRVGDIAAYLHGPGRANEHRFEVAGRAYSGGRVIGGNLGYEGHTEPDQWVKLMRQALNKRPEAKKPVWQCSLRNTAGDRRLTDAEWADAGQSFAESMGFEGHPWVMVRHGDDHVHLVVSRVDFEGQLWSRSHDRRGGPSTWPRIVGALGRSEAAGSGADLPARWGFGQVFLVFLSAPEVAQEQERCTHCHHEQAGEWGVCCAYADETQHDEEQPERVGM